MSGALPRGTSYDCVLRQSEPRNRQQIERSAMSKLIPLFVLAFAIPLATSPVQAATKGGSVDSTGCHQPGANNCAAWCDAHNKTENSQDSCRRQCWNYWCNPNRPNPSVAGSPQKIGGVAAPINGKPVHAPPPPKGSNPINAAPITNGRPTQASPSGGGGGGRLK